MTSLPFPIVFKLVLPPTQEQRSKPCVGSLLTSIYPLSHLPEQDYLHIGGIKPPSIIWQAQTHVKLAIFKNICLLAC